MKYSIYELVPEEKDSPALVWRLFKGSQSLDAVAFSVRLNNTDVGPTKLVFETGICQCIYDNITSAQDAVSYLNSP